MQARFACLVVVCGVLAVVLCSSAVAGTRSTTITQATFHGHWPFTVKTGLLACKRYRKGVGEVTFRTTNGRTYGLNGYAIAGSTFPSRPRSGSRAGYPGLFVSTDDVIRHGLKLCR